MLKFFPVTSLLILLTWTASAAHIDPQNRWQVRDFYKAVFLATELTDSGWTGSYATGKAGSVSREWLEATEARINYFRSMAGVRGNVRLDSELNAASQEAALMMSARGQLSHSPGEDWTWYTEAGAEAASQGNLALGSIGPNAIEGYMSDFGSGNQQVGHRRWMLFPQTLVMGSGDVPGDIDKGYRPSNVLWVLPERIEERPRTRDEFVAWPPRGFVPSDVVYSRWSPFPGVPRQLWDHQ